MERVKSQGSEGGLVVAGVSVKSRSEMRYFAGFPLSHFISILMLPRLARSGQAHLFPGLDYRGQSAGRPSPLLTQGSIFYRKRKGVG